MRRFKGRHTKSNQINPKCLDDEELNLAATSIFHHDFHHDGRERTTGASLVLISPYHHGYDATVVNPIRRHQRRLAVFTPVARVTCSHIPPFLSPGGSSDPELCGPFQWSRLSNKLSVMVSAKGRDGTETALVCTALNFSTMFK